MGDKTPPLHGGVTWENHPLPRGNEVLAVLCEDNGREHGLCSGDNCIGRGTDAHVVIDRYGMSKRHAIISIPDPKANHFRLTDCGSTNGTQILLVDKNRIQLLPHSTVQVTWGTRVVFAGMCAVVRKEETLADNPANVKVEAQEGKKEEEGAAHQDDPKENPPPVNEHGERSANESKEDKNLSNENTEGKRLANDDGHEDSSAEGGRESLKGDQSVADLPKDANDRPPGAECKARDNDGFLAPNPVSRPTKKPHPETKEENGNKEGTRKEKNEGDEDLPWTDDIDYTATQMFEQESRYWVRDGTQTEDFLSTQQERVWDGLDELIEEVAGKEDKEKKEDDGSEGKGERKEKAAEEGEGKEKEAKENENEKSEAQKEAERAGAERPESPVISAPENGKGSVGDKVEEDENKENETGNSDSWDMPWIDGPSQMVDDDISMYAADRQRWEGTQMGETQCGWGDDLDDLIGGKKGEECEVEGEAGEKEGNGMGVERVEKKEEAKEKESENKEGREKVEGDEGVVGAGGERIDGGDVCENKEEKREGLDGLKEENGLIDEKRKEGSEKNEEVEKGNDKVEGEEKKEDDEPEMIPNTPMGMGINGANKEGNEKEGGEDEKEVRSEQRVGSGEDEKEGTGEDRKEDDSNGVDSRGNIRTGEETSEGSENSEVSRDIERKEFTEENEESRDTKEEENKDTSLTEKAETKTGEAENEGAVQSKKPSKGGRGRKKATPLAKITNRYPPLIPDQSETTTVPNPPNQGTEESDTQSKPRIIPRFYAKSRAEPPATPGTPPHMTPGQSNLSTPVSAQSNTQSNPPSAANSPQEFGENADGGEWGSKREAEISTESGGKGSRGRPKKRQKITSTPTTPASAPPDHSLPLSAGSHNLRNVRVQCQDIGVMFTGIEPTKKEEAAARKIEAKLVSEPSQCTYLVADEVKRTVKFLAGLCVCKYVVTRDWLEASAKLGKPVGPENGIERFFIRPANQKGFGIYEALHRAQAKKLLEGKSIYATPNLSMKPAQLQTIVECAGGVLLDKPPPTFDKDTIIISSVENCSHHTPLEELGYSINTIELLLTGILKQELSLGEFLVDSISTVTKRAAPAFTRPPAKTKRQK